MPAALHVARLLLAAVALAAIGFQLWLHVEASYNVLNFFSYFTNLSNLFAIVGLVLSACARRVRRSTLDVVRYLSAVNMAVVGIVFVVLLRDVDLGGLRPWVNTVMHYVMPVAVVLDWLLWPSVTRMRPRLLVLALVFPALYLVYALGRGAAVGWYPYPFLNPANVGGPGGVALYSVGIFVTFLVVAAVLFVAGNRAARSEPALRG